MIKSLQPLLVTDHLTVHFIVSVLTALEKLKRIKVQFIQGQIYFD